MDIKPIQRVSISDQVCDQIKQLILSGTWKPGQKIPPETELAESFGVSRVSIREALLKLTAVGLLESRFSGGNYVREVGADIYLNAIVPVAYMGTDSILEVLEFRQVVEAKQAGLAAKKATSEDVKHLEQMIEDMEREIGNLEAFSEADLKFHIALAHITKNTLLVACMQLISDVLRETMPKLIDRRGYDSGIRCHREILEKIRNNDEKGATALMDSHIEDVCKTFMILHPEKESTGR